jgi:hypothetical protein
MTRLIERYEQELFEAARRLEEAPAGRARPKHALRLARHGAAAVAVAGALAVVVAVSLLVLAGGGTPEEAAKPRLAGVYESQVRARSELPKGAPRGSALALEREGGYRLTTGVHRLVGTYATGGGTIQFGGPGEYAYLPGQRTAMVPLPDAAGRCRDAVGVYRLDHSGDTLRLVLLADRCGPRARVLTATRWLRRGG